MTRRRGSRLVAQPTPSGRGRRPATGATDPYHSWNTGGLSLASTAHLASHFVMPTICPPSQANAVTYSRSHSSSRSGPTSLCMKSLAVVIGLLADGTKVGPRDEADPTKDNPDLLKNHPDLVNALVSFALSVRSEDQIKAIEERLSPCNCDTNHYMLQVLHTTLDSDPITNPSQKLARSLFGFLTYLARFTSGSLHRSAEKGENRNRRDKALREFSHYVLDDAQAAIDSAACWFTYLPTRDRTILSFIDDCLIRYPTFHPTTSSPGGQQLIAFTTLELHQAVMNLPNGISLVTTPNSEARKENGETMKMYAHFIRVALRPDRVIRPPPPMVLELINGTPVEFFNIVDHLDPADRDFLKSLNIPMILSDISLLTLPYTKQPILNTTYMAKVFENSPIGVDLLNKQATVFCTAWSMIRHCFEEGGCHNTDCKKAPAGKKFAKCAACGVPSYCSKECQKASWNHQNFPHRSVCRDLAKLFKAWPAKPDDGHKSLMTTEGKFRWNDQLRDIATSIGIDEGRARELSEAALAGAPAAKCMNPGGMYIMKTQGPDLGEVAVEGTTDADSTLAIEGV